uniref:Arp2/3 complex 34 kDa subunit n=1 Tax=Macrostomum lignano TaxID=282301 RepID=A0A1I8FHF0_9PLAT
ANILLDENGHVCRHQRPRPSPADYSRKGVAYGQPLRLDSASGTAFALVQTATAGRSPYRQQQRRSRDQRQLTAKTGTRFNLSADLWRTRFAGAFANLLAGRLLARQVAQTRWRLSRPPALPRCAEHAFLRPATTATPGCAAGKYPRQARSTRTYAFRYLASFDDEETKVERTPDISISRHLLLTLFMTLVCRSEARVRHSDAGPGGKLLTVSFEGGSTRLWLALSGQARKRYLRLFAQRLRCTAAKPGSSAKPPLNCLAMFDIRPIDRVLAEQWKEEIVAAFEASQTVLSRMNTKAP